MHDESEHEDVGLLARLFAGAVGVICGHPWIVLFVTLLSCAVSGFYTWNNLTYLTHRNDLISNKKDYLKRWHQYVEEFGNDDDMVVVVRGDDSPKMKAVLEEIAAEIAEQPASFER